jgi:hypothetical protein
VETNDGAGVVILDAVRCPSCVDVVTNLQQSWPLVLIARDEPSVLVVPERCLVHQSREVWCFRQILCADGVKVVPTLRATWRVRWAKIARLELGSRSVLLCLPEQRCAYRFRVGFRGQVPQASCRIDDTCAGNTDSREDVIAATDVCCQERYTDVTGFDDISSLRIDLIEIVLCRRDKDILDTIACCVHQRLREHLFSTDAIEVAKELCSPDVAKVGAGDCLRIEVVCCLVSSSGDITSPSDGVRLAQ